MITSDSKQPSFLETNNIFPENPNYGNQLSKHPIESIIYDHNLESLDLTVAEELDSDFGSIIRELHHEIASSENISSIPHVPEYNNERREHGGKGTKNEERKRIAFRTKSGVEIMDDGFRWRKYGKKAVKNNPNPRNYYRCSTRGCNVKKRVERDREDSSYVITTYEGVHNHQSTH